MAQGFDWWNLLTKLFKDNEKYLETAKTNDQVHCGDKHAVRLGERKNERS